MAETQEQKKKRKKSHNCAAAGRNSRSKREGSHRGAGKARRTKLTSRSALDAKTPKVKRAKARAEKCGHK